MNILVQSHFIHRWW